MMLWEILDGHVTDLVEKWTKKYKRSIDCSKPRGFSQQAHCAGRKKRQAGGKTKSSSIRENRMDTLVESMLTQLTAQGLTEAQAVSHIDERLDEDLRKWFQQKWVRFGPDGKIRGACARGKDSEGKPKCLPQSKAHALGKKGRATAARRKRREDPNADRRGAARNVATKSKTSESFDREEFLRHMAKLRAREELRKTDPVKALVQDLKDQDKQQAIKKSSDDSDLGDPNIDPLIERLKKCPHCGGPVVSEQELEEKQDACYYKVKSRYKVWPSAYASGALVQCRKKGAANWGKSKKK